MPIPNSGDFVSSFNSDRLVEAPRRRRKSPLHASAPSNISNHGRPLKNASPVVAGGNGQMPQPRPWNPSFLFSQFSTRLLTITVGIICVIAGFSKGHTWLYKCLGIPPYTFIPDPLHGDYSWVEYLPYAYSSQFRQPPSELTPDDKYMRAAWRVFNLHEVNVEWADPQKREPTPEESYACFLQVDPAYNRLGEIWDKRRGVQPADVMPPSMPGKQTVLRLSEAQLSVVRDILDHAYRDALFLCMTPEHRTKYLNNIEWEMKPPPESYFELHAKNKGGRFGAGTTTG